MSFLTDKTDGTQYLLMGNEAIVRGALESGIKVASGYPGTPSSEIIENLAEIAKERNIYVEWSANEKVAMEVAAAGSFAGLRSLCAMKQNGINVASDFLLHLALTGTRAGMVIIPCDDPGGLSSVNEGESRFFARQLEIPLLEPGSFQEAKDMLPWAFDLSEELMMPVMFRSVTRLSHASGNVRIGPLPEVDVKPVFKHDGEPLDPIDGSLICRPAPVMKLKHSQQQEKIKRAAGIFEDCPFNTYIGPENPELLIITSSACNLYCLEAINILELYEKVAVLKLGTTWPLPQKLIKKHLLKTDKILIVEEVIPFLEENIKVLAAEMASEIGIIKFYGKNNAIIPSAGELNPDLIISALTQIFNIKYRSVCEEYAKAQDISVPSRDLTFCPGCPHRASFWSLHNALELDGSNGFVCGDIGCYSMGQLPCGFNTLKTIHSMGSGAGLASGFGKFGELGFEQPVLAVCGDSTFFHTAIPALVNAQHHKSDFTMVVLDNSGTAMTGFQTHPGLKKNALGEDVPDVDIADICRAIGAKVEIRDPFELDETQNIINDMIKDKHGLKILILRQKCALSPERKTVKKYEVRIAEDQCLGENCGCNRLCTRIFKCPGLVWDFEKKVAKIDDVICTGCGICSQICPSGAILKKEVA